MLTRFGEKPITGVLARCNARERIGLLGADIPYSRGQFANHLEAMRASSGTPVGGTRLLSRPARCTLIALNIPQPCQKRAW